MYKNVFLIVRVCSRWLLRNMVVWLHSMTMAYSQHELSLWMDVLEDYKHLWSTIISYSSFCIRWHRMFSWACFWNANYGGRTSTQTCALNRGCTSIPAELHFLSTLHQLYWFSCAGSLKGMNKVVKKHCQRHNGPEGWVHLAKVTSWCHITNLDHILSSESRLSIN